MAGPKRPEARDRVRRTDTGETGTCVDRTTDSGDYGVLPDTGPKELRTWPGAVTERTGGPVRSCSRCDSPDHRTFDCPAGTR